MISSHLFDHSSRDFELIINIYLSPHQKATIKPFPAVCFDLCITIVLCIASHTRQCDLAFIEMTHFRTSTTKRALGERRRSGGIIFVLSRWRRQKLASTAAWPYWVSQPPIWARSGSVRHSEMSPWLCREFICIFWYWLDSSVSSITGPGLTTSFVYLYFLMVFSADHIKVPLLYQEAGWLTLVLNCNPNITLLTTNEQASVLRLPFSFSAAWRALSRCSLLRRVAIPFRCSLSSLSFQLCHKFDLSPEDDLALSFYEKATTYSF